MPVGLKILAMITVVACALSGCRNSSPQYQVIPAILDNDIAKVESLLDDTANVDVNWKAGGFRETALITAAGHNGIAIAKLLLQRGANPNIATDENETALQAAAYHGFTDMVRLLIATGADVNSADTRYG